MDGQWFRRLGDGEPDAIRLICFPHAGGSAGVYAPLSRLLPPHLDLRAVQYPGRQDRRFEQPVTDIRELAGTIAEKLRADDDRPRVFFGHSMGALVAYETARALEARQAPAPLRLFLSGRGAPARNPDPRDAPPDDAAILTAVRRLGGTGAAVLDDPELVAMVLPALRADYGALASYSWSPGEPLNIPITVLCGADDPVVTVADAAGWRARTRAGSEMKVFPGGHFYLDRQLGEVAEVIVRGVRSAAAGQTGDAARA